MELSFYLDPETGQPHIQGHGVHENEVQEVLEGPGEWGLGRNGTTIVIGQTASGRYLRVVLVVGAKNANLVVTALDLTANQLRAYRRRKRKG